MQAACRYCGQMIEVLADNAAEAEEEASQQCDCEGALQNREIQKAKETIASLFGQGNDLCARALSEKQTDCLCLAAETVVRAVAHSVSVDLGCGTTAKIGRNTKGNIEIKRSDKIAAKMEI